MPARSYVAGNFQLVLDGVKCGFLKSVDGGAAVAEVISESGDKLTSQNPFHTVNGKRTRCAMTRNLLTLLIVGFGLLIAGRPILAHHSETAEYDRSKPVKVTGVIKKVEWQNPHIWFYVDVKDETGKVTTWGFSAAPPGSLMRRGVTKDALRIGAVVNVEGSRARDGSNNASGRSVTFPDGRNVLTASDDAR
jgi:hypothetical protein